MRAWMLEPSSASRSDRCQRLTGPAHWCRSGAALALILAATFALPMIGRADDTPEQDRVGDIELASIVLGQDGPAEVERKLGRSPCLIPSASGETVSYLYNVQSSEGRSYLRLEVNSLVDAITLSTDPPLTGVCYGPVRRNVPIRTKKGLQLGMTTDEVLRIYGKPQETFAVGALVRFRYQAMLDRPYEWDLVFRNGRLVEWSAVTTE
ncbi:hypothetical protein [Nitrospira sp. Kam-Ns4a]